MVVVSTGPFNWTKPILQVKRGEKSETTRGPSIYMKMNHHVKTAKQGRSSPWKPGTARRLDGKLVRVLKEHFWISTFRRKSGETSKRFDSQQKSPHQQQKISGPHKKKKKQT